jgi:chromosome segregation ATPase
MSKPKKQGGRDAARPDNKSAFDEVVAIVKERRKYADWMAALEAKKDQTPPAVYSKVHLDYETRLQAAIEKLESHRDTFTQERTALQNKLEGLNEQIERQTEERSETELRAQIGELSAAALTEALRVADT